MPLLRALRRTLDAVPEVGHGATWTQLFEGFGAGGSDLAGAGECKACGVDGEALRVRLAAAEARLAATQHQEQLREMAPSEEREAQETVNMSPRATVEAPMTPRVREQERTSPHSPVRNFSLSAELWRLREALAKANGSKDKVSDLEVQRLRQALASSHAKLQSYEESKEVEPDTARTIVARGDEEIRPIKPEHLPGSVVKVVPRSPVSFVSRVSPSPIRPIVSPKRTSRKTIEIAMSPPARPVQLSPHPWRGRMTESAPHINREAPSSTPSAPQAPAQSPPRPPALQPNQVMKSTVVPVSGRSPGTPVPSKKLASWTTPRAGTPAVVRVAPPALSTTRSTVQVSPAKATRAGSLSAPPVLLLPEVLSPQHPRLSAPSLVEIRTQVMPLCAKDLRSHVVTDRSTPSAHVKPCHAGFGV